MLAKRFNTSFLLKIVAATFMITTPLCADWVIDSEKSSLGFTAYSRLHDVDGHFGKWHFDGKIADDFSGNGKVIVSLSSVDSGNKRRDQHLLDPDFFDVERFPNAIYSIDSTRLTENTLEISGRLSLHGVEKPVRLNLKRKKEVTGWSLSGETILHQEDFGIVYNSFINPVENKVKLKLQIFLKQK